MRASNYQEAYNAIVAVWRDEGGQALDDIALMATVNSVLAHTFSDFFWTGFYRVCGTRLVVGPYIGTIGCLQIEFGRGVCGTAAERRETVIVPDVTQFPGHIACDPSSKSQLVVPGFGPKWESIRGLAICSARLDAFYTEDAAGPNRLWCCFCALR